MRASLDKNAGGPAAVPEARMMHQRYNTSMGSRTLAKLNRQNNSLGPDVGRKNSSLDISDGDATQPEGH